MKNSVCMCGKDKKKAQISGNQSIQKNKQIFNHQPNTIKPNKNKTKIRERERERKKEFIKI